MNYRFTATPSSRHYSLHCCLFSFFLTGNVRKTKKGKRGLPCLPVSRDALSWRPSHHRLNARDAFLMRPNQTYAASREPFRDAKNTTPKYQTKQSRCVWCGIAVSLYQPSDSGVSAQQQQHGRTGSVMYIMQRACRTAYSPSVVHTMYQVL